jgi:hypothetical protein
MASMKAKSFFLFFSLDLIKGRMKEQHIVGRFLKQYKISNAKLINPASFVISEGRNFSLKHLDFSENPVE